MLNLNNSSKQIAKSLYASLVVLLITALASGQAPNSWTKKEDFGGTVVSMAVGFSIGNKGYIGTGIDSNGYQKDFWEYNPEVDSWSQKADFGGAGRDAAIGFSIGSKGYIGTGEVFPNFYKDFWEYDPEINSWTQKADFGGTARGGAVGFSIGSKGYIGTGRDSNGDQKDFWEYDSDADSWTQKTDFGGDGRMVGVGFSIGNKGYIGTGSNPYNGYKDFWEYNPEADSWTQKADFGGTARYLAVGFSIGSKGYIGTGYDGNYNNDFWEYDPDADSWTQKANFGGGGRCWAVGFFIGGKGYIGLGGNPFAAYKDFWEYIQVTSVCVVPLNLTVKNITYSAVKLRWSAVSSAYGYQIRYKVTSTNEWMHETSLDSLKIINGLAPGTTYTCQVRSVCSLDSSYEISDWSPKQKFKTQPLRIDDALLPQLSFQIYPNPAKDNITIQFTISHSSLVCVKLFALDGKEVGTLLEDQLKDGEHSLQMNTDHLSKGTYFVRLISDFGSTNEKLIME